MRSLGTKTLAVTDSVCASTRSRSSHPITAKSRPSEATSSTVASSACGSVSRRPAASSRIMRHVTSVVHGGPNVHVVTTIDVYVRRNFWPLKAMCGSDSNGPATLCGGAGKCSVSFCGGVAVGPVSAAP